WSSDVCSSDLRRRNNNLSQQFERVINGGIFSHAANESVRPSLRISRNLPTELRVFNARDNPPRFRARRIRSGNINQSSRSITERIRLPRTTLVSVQNSRTTRSNLHLIRRCASLLNMQ